MKTWQGMTAEQFYEARDLRTGLEISEDKRLSASITLSIDEDSAKTFNGQLALLTLANISSRWCRSISFAVPEAELETDLIAIYPGDNLVDAAIRCAQEADPFGVFRPLTRSRSENHIHVGPEGEPGAYRIFSEGWLTFTGDSVDSAHNSLGKNALSAVMAACIGASHAFRAAIGDTENHGAVLMSLWNLENDDLAVNGPPFEDVQMGRIAILGNGAIGSGIAYLLPLVKAVTSQIDLVDKDLMAFHNLNRSMIFSAIQAFQELAKIVAVGSFLSASGYAVKEIFSWYDYPTVDLKNYDVIFLGANERSFGPKLMANIPPLLLGASTGKDWDAYLQRHIPLLDDCPECRMPTTPASPTPLICSTGSISTASADSGTPETGALPFLSLAAAVMCVAEMVKISLGEPYPVNSNGAAMSFKSESLPIICTNHKAKVGCTHCWNAPIFRALRSESKFVDLSLVPVRGLSFS